MNMIMFCLCRIFSHKHTIFFAAAVSGNVIVNTVAGVPSATFQPINKRLASPVIPGTLAVSKHRIVLICTQEYVHDLSSLDVH